MVRTIRNGVLIAAWSRMVFRPMTNMPASRWQMLNQRLKWRAGRNGQKPATGIGRVSCRRSNDLTAKYPYHIRYEVGGIFKSSWALYGLDRFLVDLLQKPEVPTAILNCYTDLMIDNVRSLMDVAGDKIDMLYTYDDIAIQNGLLMSPRLWRKYILPCHQRLNKVIKSYGVKIMYHSCGSVIQMIDALIDDVGIEVLNPLQPRAAGMDMQLIKDKFGKRVAFHGALDLQHTLPHGTQQDVYDEVRSRCNILGKDGGYICTSAHYLQADIPLENILTIYLTPRNVD